MAANKGKYKPKSSKGGGRGWGLTTRAGSKQMEDIGMKPKGYGPKGRKKKARIVRRGKKAYLYTK